MCGAWMERESLSPCQIRYPGDPALESGGDAVEPAGHGSDLAILSQDGERLVDEAVKAVGSNQARSSGRT